LRGWQEERDRWLKIHGIDPASAGWRAKLQNSTKLTEFKRYSLDRWNDHLDACHGECILRRPELRKIVVDSLCRFDGERYELTDFVVMPNHVHLLVAFPDDGAMLKQCESWKHFTATQINRKLGRKGRFWQQDEFDHLVRSEEQFEYLRRYLADNPRRAKLRPEEFVHGSKKL
jgi:REP element-mobilizing transposase RayT